MGNTTKNRSLIFCLLLCFYCIAPVNSRTVEKQTVMAVLTLNIARFTSWPERIFNAKEPIINLCVIGDNLVQQSFNNINKKVINNKTLHIINLSRLRNVNQCQLLYVSKMDRNKLKPLLVEMRGVPILTIGENVEFIQAGGMVGLEQVNGKMQIKINLPIIKQSELVISSRLLKLAEIVDFPYPVH